MTEPQRSPGSSGRALLAVAAFSAVLLVLFHDSILDGKVLTQADALYAFEPWKSVAPEGLVVGNELLLDQATGFLPWNDFVAEELRRGELPLWSPHNYAGIPLVGTYQSAIYWPLNWIYYAWPSWHTYVWMAFLELLAAGMFAWLFLRRLGIGAGADCDGQVLVMHDLLGLSEWSPSFVKQYANLGALASQAARAFAEEVQNGKFPDEAHSYR